MARQLLVFLALVLLAACGGSPPQASVAPSPAPPTAVPLDKIDLEPLLIQSGDLPAGYTGAQVKDVAPGAFKDFPKPLKVIDQRFQRGGKVVGGVVVLLYEAPADLDQAFKLGAGSGKYSKPQDGVGERATAYEPDAALPIASVNFVRCHAYVDVAMTTDDIAEAVAYAKRLDKRLSAAVC